MPKAKQSSVNARRVATLLAGFDTGNSSEEEAMAKGRALRRMAAEANMRVVDLLELPEVKQAVDDQMRPARTESPALHDALEQAASLREQLAGRMRDVRNLADLLERQEETSKALRGQLAQAQTRTGTATAVSIRPSLGAPSWGFEAGLALLVLVMLVAALFGGFQERTKSNGLGNSQGSSAGVLREDSAVRSISKHGAVRHRVHHGRSSAGAREIRGVSVPDVHVQVR